MARFTADVAAFVKGQFLGILHFQQEKNFLLVARIQETGAGRKNGVVALNIARPGPDLIALVGEEHLSVVAFKGFDETVDTSGRISQEMKVDAEKALGFGSRITRTSNKEARRKALLLGHKLMEFLRRLDADHHRDTVADFNKGLVGAPACHVVEKIDRHIDMRAAQNVEALSHTHTGLGIRAQSIGGKFRIIGGGVRQVHHVDRKTSEVAEVFAFHLGKNRQREGALLQKIEGLVLDAIIDKAGIDVQAELTEDFQSPLNSIAAQVPFAEQVSFPPTLPFQGAVAIDGERKALGLAGKHPREKRNGAVRAGHGKEDPVFSLGESFHLAAEGQEGFPGGWRLPRVGDRLEQIDVVEEAQRAHGSRYGVDLHQVRLISRRIIEAIKEGLPPRHPFERRALIIGVGEVHPRGEGHKVPHEELIVERSRASAALFSRCVWVVLDKWVASEEATR